MSVLLETTQGDIVIDLLVDHAPKLCENFLKLCKVKYYNFSPVHSVQKNFSFQTGDPLGPLSAQSDGGSSIWGLLSGDPAQRAFPAFFHPKLKHTERGTVGMATVAHFSEPDVRLAASQFIVSLGDNTDYLDGKSAIFGHVVEGFDVLEKINNAIVDEAGYPLVDIRILHTAILDDPYPDPQGLVEPPASPAPSRAQLATRRLGDEDQKKILDREEESEDKAAELEKTRREREARAQALTLEMVGDLPFAEVKPPENVLFVCKLNPVTQDADLELIFSRFGKILSCEVVRDHKTGDSLQYAFIEFEDKSACEAAYFKMQDVLIDDRRIHVDFSQSVSKLSDAWRTETNTKRRKGARDKGGGWGGVRELEKWRKYRDEDVDDRGPSYHMVHSEEDFRGGRAKEGAPRRRRSRSRSTDRHRRPRSRSRSTDRHRDRHQRPRSPSTDRRRRPRSRSTDRHQRPRGPSADRHQKPRGPSTDRHRERPRGGARSRSPRPGSHNGYRADKNQKDRWARR